MPIEPKILLIVGSQIISGAEYVLGDYLRNTSFSRNFVIWHAETKELHEFFSALPVGGTRSFSSLLPTGARKRKTPAAAIKKLFRVISFTTALKKELKKSSYTCVVGNNTGDILFVRSCRHIRRVLMVHDDISGQKGLHILIRIFGKQIDSYIAVAQAVKSSLVAARVPSEKIRVIYNGLQPILYRKKLYTHTNTLTILFVGHLTRRKDPLTVIQFCSLLHEQSGMRISCHMVCNQEEPEIRKAFDAAVEQSEEMIYVHLHKNVDRDAINRYYETSDFLFHPALSEALPTCILEAFQHGLPVIARNVGGIPEMITSGTNGFLFKENSELTNMARRVLQISCREYTDMSLAAYTTFCKNFTLEKKVAALNKLLCNRDSFQSKRGQQ